MGHVVTSAFAARRSPRLRISHMPPSQARQQTQAHPSHPPPPHPTPTHTSASLASHHSLLFHFFVRCFLSLDFPLPTSPSWRLLFSVVHLHSSVQLLLVSLASCVFCFLSQDAFSTEGAVVLDVKLSAFTSRLSTALDSTSTTIRVA